LFKLIPPLSHFDLVFQHAICQRPKGTTCTWTSLSPQKGTIDRTEMFYLQINIVLKAQRSNCKQV